MLPGITVAMEKDHRDGFGDGDRDGNPHRP